MASKRDIEAEGHIKQNAVDPDGAHRQGNVEEGDVEGHSMFISPTVGRDLARARDAEVDRGVRQRQQAAEAKRVFKKS